MPERRASQARKVGGGGAEPGRRQRNRETASAQRRAAVFSTAFSTRLRITSVAGSPLSKSFLPLSDTASAVAVASSLAQFNRPQPEADGGNTRGRIYQKRGFVSMEMCDELIKISSWYGYAYRWKQGRK